MDRRGRRLARLLADQPVGVRTRAPGPRRGQPLVPLRALADVDVGQREVADFLSWLREWNRIRPDAERIGFYGLDVYSLWDSLRVVMSWLKAHAPDALPDALQAWYCFQPYDEDPHRYAWSTRLVPRSCEPDVVSLLVEVRRATSGRTDDEAFDAAQNAEVAAGAERYYCRCENQVGRVSGVRLAVANSGYRRLEDEISVHCLLHLTWSPMAADHVSIAVTGGWPSGKEPPSAAA